MKTSGWVSLLLGFGASVVTALSPYIQTTLSHHPAIATVLASVIAIVAHWLPSPAPDALTIKKLG